MQTVVRCSVCDKLGHTRRTCPKAQSQRKTSAQEERRPSGVSRVEHFVTELKAFQLDLIDPEVRSAINGALGDEGLDSLISYYESNPDLARQTVDVDLDRMQYTVAGEAGQRCTTAEAIRQLFEARPDGVLWRMANQSIFSQLMLSLHQKFLRPELSIAIRNTSSEFFVDLPNSRLQAKSGFRVCTVTEDTQLALADVVGQITVDLNERSLVQKFDDLRPNVVFDDQWEQVATVLAEHEASFGPAEQKGPATGLTLDAVRHRMTALGGSVTRLGGNVTTKIGNLSGTVTNAVGTRIGQLLPGEQTHEAAKGPPPDSADFDAFSDWDGPGAAAPAECDGSGGGSDQGVLAAALGKLHVGAGGAGGGIKLYRTEEEVQKEESAKAGTAHSSGGEGAAGLRFYRTEDEVQKEEQEEEVGVDVVAEAATAVWSTFTSMWSTPREGGSDAT